MCKKFAFSLLGVLAFGVVAQAATFTLVDLPATGTDAAIGIDSSKTYTHAFDFGTSGVATINGVAFEVGLTGSITAATMGTSAQGYGYTISDTRSSVNVATHAGNDASSQADGDSATLLYDMIYHSASTIDDGVVIILSDLTPGVMYSTRLYYRSWDSGVDARTITCQADGESDGVFAETIDIELDAGGAHYLDYTFVADDTDVELQFITNDDNNGIHVYGLTNEISPSQTIATFPSPADGAGDVFRDTLLNWTAGSDAVAHDVYLGTSYDAVNASDASVLLSPGQTAASFDPGRLEMGQTYYWRVDEIAADGTVEPGKIWSFTVEPIGYPIADITATATGTSDADKGPEKTIDGSGLNEDDQHSMDSTDMWLVKMAAGEVAQIEYTFGKVYPLCQMWVWNYNVQLESMIGFGAKDVTVEYSIDGTEWTLLDDVEFAQGPGEETYTANTIVDFGGAMAQYVRLTINSGWGTVASQFGLSEVRFLYNPLWARQPNPTSGATGLDPAQTLSWRAGRQADQHEVYLDTDEQAVIDGTASMETVSESSYDAALDLNQAYYWRVDEVNDLEDPAVWTGDVWTMSTAESILIEGFEDFDDDENRIYSTWIDGWDNGTGATVGYFETPFAETTLAYSGGQSMPLSFENTGGTTVSQADRTFEASQDWSAYGIKSLSLQFFGDPANTTGQLFVEINGTQVDYDGDAGDLQIAAWMPWVIDLTGLNVQSVDTLSIGVEGSGASGLVLIDDIRVYPYEGTLMDSIEPSDEGLVAYYPLDGDATDAVGGHDGTITGTPDFVAGHDGQAIDIAANAGVAQEIIVAYAEDLALNSFTVAAWINVKDLDSARGILGTRFNSDNTFDLKVEGTRVHGDIGDGSAWVNTGVDITAAHGGVISLGDWHHVAYAIDAEAGTAHLYLDGVLSATITFSGTPLLMKSDQELHLGNSSGTEYMNGMIDEVRIYNRALSAGEMAGLVGRPGPFYLPF